jgi:hypothetical protein
VIAPLRRLLLRWVFSRGRWIHEVLVESAFGVVFLAAPYVTMAVLEIRPSPEAAALFRLYGIVLVARGILRHATFGVPAPEVVRRSLAGDLAFTFPGAAVLVLAIRDGLAGPATWAVVALFVGEGVLALVALAGLWSVTPGDLDGALGGRMGAGPFSDPAQRARDAALAGGKGEGSSPDRRPPKEVRRAGSGRHAEWAPKK